MASNLVWAVRSRAAQLRQTAPAPTVFTCAISGASPRCHIHAAVEGTRLTLDLDEETPMACLDAVTVLLELIYDRPAVALGEVA